MLEIAEAAVIRQRLFEQVATTECNYCYSLQPCHIGDSKRGARCVNWRACLVRQQENRHEPPIKLTDADVAGLLERMETQQADMERLKRIEAAAITWTQARDVWLHTCNIATCEHLDDAANVLMSVVRR
jgi:hypothetical protein